MDRSGFDVLGGLVTLGPEVLALKEALERRYAEIELRESGEPQCPPTWGGYRVRAETVEFWQGRPNRLHDRLVYRKSPSGAWEIVRLAP